MLRYLLLGTGDVRSYIIQLLLCLPIILFSLSLHEAAHGCVANKLGDPTARDLGRLTLNPLKHLDPLGFLCMLLAGFGWAKPVPINTRYFKKPRRDMALSGAAGPASNLCLAVIFTALLKIAYELLWSRSYSSDLTLNIAYFTLVFLFYGIQLNLTLAVFNLLPVPPLDGSRIFYVLLPPKYYFGIMKYEKYISLAIMLLLMLGVLSPVISFVSTGIMKGLFSLFSLESLGYFWGIF